MLFDVKMVFSWDKFLNYIKMFQHRIFGGGGWGKICHSFALTNMLLYFQKTLSKSFVWVVALNYYFNKETEIQDGGSKMADNHFKFYILLLPIAFSRCTSVSLLQVHKKG